MEVGDPGNPQLGTEGEVMKKPKVETLRYVSFKGEALWDALLEHDLALTNHDGFSGYTKEESLREIRRHHKKDDERDDFSELIAAIKALPAGVLVEW